MPISRWRATTSATDWRSAASSSPPGRSVPSARGRLPTWVVRIRSRVLRFIAPPPPPASLRLLHHVRLPQVPGARRVAGIGVAQRAFAGRDVVDWPAERERDRLHAGILVGEDGARRRDAHLRRAPPC